MIDADLDRQKPVTREGTTEETALLVSEGAEPNLDQKVQMLSSCLSYAIYEANVYWQRNAIYLTINSFMVGAIAATITDLPIYSVLFFGAFGLYFNWHWVHVNKYSKFLAERWREDARALAGSSPELSKYMKALLKKPRIKSPQGIRPSDVMNRLSGSFRLVWGVVFVYAIISVFPDIIDQVSLAIDYTYERVITPKP